MPPPRATRARSIGTKLGLVGATGFLIGAAAFGLSGVASADSPTTESGGAGADRVVAATRTLTARAAHTIDVDVSGHDDGASFTIEMSPEDEAVFEEFEQCLADAGLDDSGFGNGEISGELSEDDLEALDAEFDALFAECEPILEGLSEDVLIEDVLIGDVLIEGLDDLSPEDEAVLERFDECLDDLGVHQWTGDDEDDDEDDGEELSDAEIEELDEMFAECDSILDELSEDAEFFSFGDGACDDHDEYDPEHEGEEILEEGDGSDA
ncbi:MAG: hypothetical protein ACR2QO_23525 [Acidimicrobiales bacterium]